MKRKYRVCLIAAVDQNGLLGLDGDLPWHCPADLRRFRYLTMGRVCLMGRRTAESLKKPLRDRVNLVLTRDRTWSRPGFHAVHNERDIQRALKKFQQHELWVIGGATLYTKYLPHADIVHLTVLATNIDTTDKQAVYFPMSGLRKFGGVHAATDVDPNVVFWTFTPHAIQTGRSKPASAIVC